MAKATGRSGKRSGGAKKTAAAPKRTAQNKGPKGKPATKKPQRKPAAAKQPKQKRSLRRRLFRATALLAIWGFVLAGAVVAYLYLTLPSLEGAATLKRGPTAALLAKDGAFLASYGELHGQTTTVGEMPPHLPRAVIAIEDRRFYEHGGIDLWGVARAIVVNVTSGSLRQGASTITQQLARNLLLSQERTFARKAREAMLAFELERRFGKDQILTLYLNRVYFGGGAYGVDAAARRFFGKPAVKANLWEAALLAGSLKAPSRLAPDRNPEAAAARARLVLNAMAEEGYIPREAALRPMEVATHAATALDAPVASGARYFADWALGQADGFMAGLDRDVLVQTTLNLRMQRLAEQAIADGLAAKPKGVAAWPSQAALVAIEPGGAVRAMVGGRSYVESQFNRVVQARRQMGSVFKPFVFLAALEAGWEPSDFVLDTPVVVGKWRPRNFRDRYYGRITMREALARSLNAPTVRLAEAVGRSKAVAAARRLGVASPMPEGPSVSLGAGGATLLELTAAYAAFADGGRFSLPHGVSEIRDRAGDVLYKPSVEATRAVDPAVVQRMNDMLAAAVAWGSGRSSRIDRDSAGKTGTSQRNRDGWFIGYTADMAVGIWAGRDDDRPVKGLTGGGMPARVWRTFMEAIHDVYAPKPLEGLAGYRERPRPASPSAAVAPAGDPASPKDEGPRLAPKPKPYVVYEYPGETFEP